MPEYLALKEAEAEEEKTGNELRQTALDADIYRHFDTIEDKRIVAAGIKADAEKEYRESVNP